jgi:glutamate formiminotransferase/formiminotetrahydrofolate cyclodeaminase
MKLIECVPNFSEGRNPAIIQYLIDSISKIRNVSILDVDSGADTNRTVITFIGTPDSVAEAGYRIIAEASIHIDMNTHRGIHPRIGATDVFPIVPLRDVSMEECILISRQLAERVGNELHIPVFLYEQSACHENRKSLSAIRTGGYEKMNEKIKKPEWEPDFGPAELHPRAGATVIGARSILIAYNINIRTHDAAIARYIASELRETGRKIIIEGQLKREPGFLKACQAIGWYLPSYGKAQVSMNLRNYIITPPHVAYEACREVALKYGTAVAGSELIGMIPREALLMAGRFYARKFQKGKYDNESLIALAVDELGLNSVRSFDSKKKIIEEQVQHLS